MPIKLCCNRCHDLIREISPSEAGSLTGKEVCTECEAAARNAVKDIDKLYKKLLNELSAKHNKAIVELEALIHETFK